ncbi:MAG: hypothetical protein WCK31_04525 [bacterium]
MEQSTEDLIKEFYSKPYYLSYSGLNKLLYSPGLFFRHYVLNQREDKLESYLVEGKVTHCLLLEDGSFDEKFILMPSSLPSGNTRTVIDKVYAHMLEATKDGAMAPTNLDAYSTTIVDVLKEINLHQKLKTDQQRVEKIITDETKSYWEFLKIKGDKDLIDSDVLQSCREAVDAVKADPTACTLLGLFISEMDNVEIKNEQYFQTETDKHFGLKGFTDSVKIDHTATTIYINDLKKTNKTLDDFQETIEFYNYWSQAAIYDRLIQANFYDLIVEGYKVVFNFVVVDKYLQVYCFEVSPETMQNWQIRLEEKLNEASWHYESKNYKLPYKFAAGKVIL